jgi:hypothetical protein
MTIPNSVFVVCLLCSDLVQGISGYFQFIWAAEGRVFAGSLCTAQAAMLLFGDNGTAVWWWLPNLCLVTFLIPVPHV